MHYDLRHLTPALAAWCGVQPPAGSIKEPIVPVLDLLQTHSEQHPVERLLVFHPDALGLWLYYQYCERFCLVEQYAPLMTPVRAMVPPKTPVCFASMYTGLLPEQHGIRKYDRPVVKARSLFDELAAAGKRVALTTVADSSMDLIFRERPIDYFSEPYDPQTEWRGRELIQADEHDVVVVYQQEYDDMLHRTTPESPECLRALDNHLKSFERLAEAFNLYWKDYRRGIVFAPDHGSHLNPATGCGDHGLNCPEDLEVAWFLGVKEGQ